MSNVLAIHGAYSSPASFNYLRLVLPDHNWKFVDYSKKTRNLSEIIEFTMHKITEPTHVIGHSLGGVIAMNLLSLRHVKNVITLASPLGGIKNHFWANMFIPWDSFINDLTPTGKYVRSISAFKMNASQLPNRKIIHLVATNGYNPYIHEENDGVVTVSSQTHNTIGSVIKVATNHHEILQHEKTVETLKINI